MLDLAHARGADVVSRPGMKPMPHPPGDAVLSNEELVAALLSPACTDRPEILRPAAQLITRGVLDLERLSLLAVRERSDRVLAALARQALHAEPGHPVWEAVYARFRRQRPLGDVLLHWTRLAEPIMKDGRCNAASWKLVA